MKRFFALLTARNKEYFRDRGSLAWGLLFPLLIVIGFSFAFSSTRQDVFKVAWLGSAQRAETPLHREILATKFIQFIEVESIPPALEKLRRHQVDMLINPGDSTQYWINESSPKGYLLEKMLFASEQRLRSNVRKQTVDGKEIRYVDWLLGGLLSMNIMFSSLFGVGYVIVRYRNAGVLRRLKATPVSAFEFLSAQVASEEFAGGVLNVITWPMMLFSGVWFSLEGTNPWLQKFAQVFPLTHMVNAARAVMIEGASLFQIADHLAVLAGLTVVFMAVSSFIFRWE